jgi:hypothetical protein
MNISGATIFLAIVIGMTAPAHAGELETSVGGLRCSQALNLRGFGFRAASVCDGASDIVVRDKELLSLIAIECIRRIGIKKSSRMVAAGTGIFNDAVRTSGRDAACARRTR